jgi:hypothetical protein
MPPESELRKLGAVPYDEEASQSATSTTGGIAMIYMQVV